MVGVGMFLVLLRVILSYIPWVALYYMACTYVGVYVYIYMYACEYGYMRMLCGIKFTSGEFLSLPCICPTMASPAGSTIRTASNCK